MEPVAILAFGLRRALLITCVHRHRFVEAFKRLVRNGSTGENRFATLGCGDDRFVYINRIERWSLA
jgi:hypothetical protein